MSINHQTHTLHKSCMVMYSHSFTIHCHTMECSKIRFWDTFGNTSNARIGIPASRHPLSYSVSRTPLDIALVYIFHCRIFVKLYPAIRDIEWHRLQFLVELAKLRSRGPWGEETHAARECQESCWTSGICWTGMTGTSLFDGPDMSWCCPSFVFSMISPSNVTRS